MTTDTKQPTDTPARAHTMTPEWADYRRVKAREWLMYVARIQSQARDALFELQAVRLSYSSVHGMTYDDMPHSNNAAVEPDAAMVRYLQAIEDHESKLDAVRRECVYYLDHAEAALRRVSCHPVAGEVLRLHYLDSMPYLSVADRVGYSVQRVKQIAADGLVEVYDYMPCEFRDRIPSAL